MLNPTPSVCASLHLVPVNTEPKSTVTSDPNTHIMNSRYSVITYGRVRQGTGFSPTPHPTPLHSYTNLLPVMVMPVDTHWKMPTPGTKFNVMTGSRTSFTFILGGDTHIQ